MPDVYRALFRQSRDGFVITNDDAVVTEANAAAEEIFGVAPGTLTGQPLSAFFDRQEGLAERWARFLDGSEPRVSTTLRRPDGSTVAIEATAVGHALPGTHVAIIRDMQQQRQMEEELRASESRYRQIIENASEVIYTMTLEGILLSINGASERLLGYPPEEMVGKHMARFMTPAAVEKSRTLGAAKFGGSIDATTYEIEMLHRDGYPLIVEITSRVFYRDGKPAEIHGIGRDVTEQRRAENAIRESEEAFRAVVEQAPLGAWIFDGTRIAYINPAMARIVGRSVEDLAEPGAFEAMFAPDEQQRIHERGRRRLAGFPEPEAYDTEIIAADGTIRLLQARAARIHYRGKPATLVFAHDVTEERKAAEERRQLEAKMQQAQKLESLGVLAGGIAHDFNNLLVSVLGNADLALMTLPPDSPGREFVADIQAAAQRAAELTRQMLAYSGRGRFLIEPIDVTRLTREMAHLLEVSVGRRAAMHLHLADDIPLVLGDATQIRQVVMNLITNAGDAIGDRGGVISLTTGVMTVDRGYLASTTLDDDLTEGQYVFIEVSDTGEGMDAATRERIFEPFFTTKFTGRGLGLAAVIGIVRGHKGAIKVYSEPGKGSTFKVLLPVATDDASAAPRGSTGDEVPHTDGTGTILVIDDDASVRHVARRMLEEAGYTVVDCDSGEGGLKEFEQHRNDIRLVVLDLTMPGMNGEEVFRHLRQLDPAVRVVLVSGYNQADATAAFGGKGLAGFVQKPFGHADLLGAIAKVLAG